MKKHLLKISVIALLLVGNWGCKKETDFKEVKNVNINEMKNWFQSNINSDSFLSSVKPNWDKIYKGFDGNLSYYEIKCDNLLNTINGSFADMQTDQQRQEKASRTTVKLIIFDSENGQRTAAYMFINELGADNNSDNTHYKQMGELSGTVIFYSLDGKLSNGYVYKNGSIIKTIKNAPENISSTDSSQRSVMIAEAGNCSVSATAVYQQVCITIGEIYDSKSGEANKIAAGGTYTSCTWVCVGSFVTLTCTKGFDLDTNANAGNDGGYSGGGGGGGNSSSNIIPLNPYLPGYDKSPIDPKKYANCFKNIQNAGATYKVVVQVQEPTPGIRLNYGVNGVGHTAITLIKKGSNGVTVSQTIGFYPSGNKFSGPSKMVDNAKSDENNNIEFTVSMEFDLAGNVQAFNKILDGISNPPTEYELLGMNCTAFVVGVCNLGGITLPNALNGVATFYDPLNLVQAMTPSELGASMREAKANGDSRVKSNPAPTQSHGPCN